MTASRHPAEPSAATVKVLLRRFLSVNQERLRRTRDVLAVEHRVFFDLLPLLFHVNDVRLPGFVSELAPAGIPGYQPGRKVLEAAQKLSREFAYTRKALPIYPIEALYLMGSSGTIAHSEKSDFDIWVCHRSPLEPRDYEALERKCWELESWAASLGVEAHFFLVDQAQFRAGRHGVVTEESSGSAQHHLLLDEFYRTGLLVAGRYPVWWLVPPELEGSYGEVVARMFAGGVVERSEVMDFGGLGRVPAGEFYGATLWQLYKGIDSPYKSLLKIQLMEYYAARYPEVDLLSLRFKQAVHDGESAVERLDPYLMLIRLLEEYLQGLGEPERVEVVRRGFYFKVGERLSEPDDPRDPNWRRELLRDVTRSWQWGGEHLAQLDARPVWKADRVMEERRNLVAAFTSSYRVLSDFARSNADAITIDLADLTLLGRKLHAAFERRAGKVEQINPGISADLREGELSIHRVGGIQGSWLLFRGNVPFGAPGYRPVKRSRSLLELLAWCHINRLITADTNLYVQPRQEGLNPRELREILKYFEETFPDGRLDGGRMDDFARPSQAVHAALFLNVGIDPLERLSAKGMHLTNAQTDPLSYGARADNLALSFDLLMTTSWNEVLTYRFTGDTALLECLCEYLGWSPLGRGETPPALLVRSHSSPRGPGIARRVEGLFDDVVGRYYRGGPSNARYLLRLGRHYYLLRPNGEAMRYQRLESREALLRQLGTPAPEFSPVFLDREVLGETPLPAIYALNRPGVVQFFYQPLGPVAEVYVLDERGSLYQQTTDYLSEATLLGRFERFFFAVLPRRHYVPGEDALAVGSGEVEYHRLHREPEGRWLVEPRHGTAASGATRYFNLQVIGERGEEGRTLFTIYCDDCEFSTLEYGDGLFRAVAKYLMEQRRGGQGYPFYITDVDISQLFASGERGAEIQTVHFLNYKKRIEEYLNSQVTPPDEAPRRP